MLYYFDMFGRYQGSSKDTSLEDLADRFHKIEVYAGRALPDGYPDMDSLVFVIEHFF